MEANLLENGGRLLAVLLLILLNGFFVAAEFALVTVRRTRVEQLVAERRPGARNVADAVKYMDSYIAACQLGITIASLALGWVGEPTVARLLEPALGRIAGHAVSVIVAFAIITALHVVAGELAPKGVALQYPEQSALFVAGPLRLFRAVFRPAIWLLNEGGWAAARVVGVRRDVERDTAVGAQELRLVFQASALAGAIETGEQFFLERVFRFYDRRANEVMVPRTEVVWLEAGMTVREFYEVFDETPHSRFPVYRDTLDSVIGVINIKDVLRAVAQGKVNEEQPLDLLVRPAYFVPETKLVGQLFEEMQKERHQMAVIVDEYGGTAGIVTLELLLEEMVGPVSDELGLPEREIQAIDERTFRVDGGLSLHEAREDLDLSIPEGDYETMAGYVLDLLGHIPVEGESINGDGYRITVAKVTGRKVEELVVLRAPEARADEQPEA